MQRTRYLPSLLVSLTSLVGTAGCAVEGDSHLDVDSAALGGATAAPRTLADAGRVTGIADVCPPARTDALCIALRSGDAAAARTAAAAHTSPSDAAFRAYARERQVALLVWNALTDLGRAPAPADYAAAASTFLDEHYPAYRGDSTAFALARQPLPPESGAGCARTQALVIFPGVLRIEARTEFSAQAAVIRAALPCVETVVVDTDNFMDPVVNAEVARQAIAAVDASAPLHLIGYSQGATNVLETLVDHPAIASRVKTVLTLNSAAHGSEVADTLFGALERRDDALLDTVATALGFSAEQREALIGSAIDDLRDFFVGHAAGARSLTTGEAARFWAERGASLPRHVLYTSFRSVITDSARNLPVSNALFFPLLERAGGDVPYNDMQVLLPKQSLGGPVAGTEVVLPVAEGNHWQWEYTEGQMAEALMPASMTDRIPQRALLLAYVQTLLETGMLR